MNIQQLMYGVSEDKFFGDNFDIELDDTSDNEFTISSHFDIELTPGSIIVITVRLLSLDQILVKFGNDYGDHMNLVYVTKVFDMDKFINWIILSLIDFVYQSKKANKILHE